MTAVAAAFPRAFAVRFRELYRWDPSSFHRILWHWPADVLRPFGSGLRARKEKVDRTKLKFSDLQPITIHFDGSIDRRRVDADREYMMDLFAAKPGDIVVAKIDLKNGAVGIVPEGWDNVVVTGHFAVYEPVRSKLLPEYLHLLIQTAFFKAHLWRNKVGAEGRKEVKLDFFEAERIPFPPLPVQREIVAAWESAQKAAAATAAKIEQLEYEIEAGFLADLGLKASARATMPKAFAVRLSQTERWGVGYNQQVLTRLDPAKGKYQVVRLGEVLADLENGWSPKCLDRPAQEGEWGVLKMGAVSFGVFDQKQNKAIPKTLTPQMDLEVRPGDFLISRANITRLVGACVLVKDTRRSLMLCDKIFRAIWRHPSPVEPRYLDEILKVVHLRQQIEGTVTGSSPTMKNITKPALLALRLPLPPLSTQRRIVEDVTARRTEIANLRTDAKARADAAKANVEAMILGTMKVGAP